MRKSLLFIALLPLMAFACAGTHAARPPAAVTQPAEKNTEFLNKLEERMHEEEVAFKALSDKMDEYQMLTAACESLADTEENRDLRASCKREAHYAPGGDGQPHPLSSRPAGIGLHGKEAYFFLSLVLILLTTGACSSLPDILGYINDFPNSGGYLRL